MAPATKRSRTDDDDDDEVPVTCPHQSALHESPHFWFLDGSIVLQVEQTLFRVHTSMLARYSEVFKDMLDISQPSTLNEPMYDGCPLVFLSDVADDVYEFLSVIYDGSKRFDRQRLEFSLLVSMIRLGKKYQVDFFFKEGLSVVRSDYPKEIENWTSTDDGVIQFNSGGWSESVRKLIKLAHEFGLQSVLPSLYLDLGTGLSLATLIDDSGNASVRLGPEIVKTIVSGRERLHAHLRDRRVTYLRKVLTPDSRTFRDCTTLSLCVKNRVDLFNHLPLWRAGPGVDAMAPNDLHPAPILPIWKHGLCNSCCSQIDEMCMEIRRDTWARLPEFFGLGKWEDLKDEGL